MTPSLVLAAVPLVYAGQEPTAPAVPLTHAPHGHVLANRGCWSADGTWLLYDARADETVFDGRRIERVHADTGEVQVLVDSADAPVGVPVCAAADDRFVFLRGPANATADWPYAAWHRHGALGRLATPDRTEILDARDLSPPLTAGALRGGTHLHTFGPDGRRIASTYEDHLLATAPAGAAEANRRVVAVTELDRRVEVAADHPRDHAGAWTVVVTRVHDRPTPGSDQIARAYSDAWVDGERSDRIAFFGLVTGADGREFSEVFLAELPDDLTRAGDGPLQGTPTTRPAPPVGVVQRRLTFTADERHPGAAGPRHWPLSAAGSRVPEEGRDRSRNAAGRRPDSLPGKVAETGTREPLSRRSFDAEPSQPDPSRVGEGAEWRQTRAAVRHPGRDTLIGFYRKGDDGRIRFCTVSTAGGPVRTVTTGGFEPTSAFTWHPDGTRVAFAADGSVFVTDVDTGAMTRLTAKGDPGPTHHACVWSPDGARIAYTRPVDHIAADGTRQRFAQVFVVGVREAP